MPILQERLIDLIEISTKIQQRLENIEIQFQQVQEAISYCCEETNWQLSVKYGDTDDFATWQGKKLIASLPKINQLLAWIDDNRLTSQEIRILQDEKTHFKLTSKKNLNARARRINQRETNSQRNMSPTFQQNPEYTRKLLELESQYDETPQQINNENESENELAPGELSRRFAEKEKQKQRELEELTKNGGLF